MRVSVGLVLMLVALACVPPAPQPCTECAGVCVDLQADSANCGACGTRCEAGRRCSAGACERTCASPQRACGSVCTDVQNDSANCGTCGVACGGGQRCEGGACVTTCATGLTDCSGACVDLQSDRQRCGDCGTACGASEVCVAGACAATCPLTVCGGACVDPQTSPLHCGGCNRPCAVPAHMAGGACAAGACGPVACLPGFLDCNASLADGCETAGPSCFALASVSITGGAGNGASHGATVDDTGTRVVFTSTSSDLVPGDTNGQPDVFLRDFTTRTTTRLSVQADGGELAPGAIAGAISGDGRVAAYLTTGQVFPLDTNTIGHDVILVELATGARRYGLLGLDGGQPAGNTAPFGGPLLSTTGEVLMQSGRMSGLYPNDTIQNESDIFVADLATGGLKVASLTPAGAFVTSGTLGHNAAAGFISGDGRYVAYGTFGQPLGPTGDLCANLYVTDLVGPLPTVTRVLADDGSAFTCNADRQAASGGLIANAGAALFFHTRSALPSGALGSTYNIYRRGSLMAAAPSTLVTGAVDGGAADGPSFTQWIDEAGTRLAFVSDSSNLVSDDENGTGRDCFVWSEARGTSVLSQPANFRVITDGGAACATVRLSRNGQFAVLEANDAFVAGDTNGSTDVYVRRAP